MAVRLDGIPARWFGEVAVVGVNACPPDLVLQPSSALLRRHGIEFGGGLGDLRGKVWRIGLMGESSNAGDVSLALRSLGNILREQGFKADVRAGVEAAAAGLA